MVAGACNPSLGCIGTRMKAETFSIGQTVPVHTLPCILAFLSLQPFHHQHPPFLKTESSVAKASIYSELTTHQESALALRSLLRGHFNKPMTQIQLPHTAPLRKEGESQELGTSQPLCGSSSLYPQNRALCCSPFLCF